MLRATSSTAIRLAIVGGLLAACSRPSRPIKATRLENADRSGSAEVADGPFCTADRIPFEVPDSDCVEAWFAMCGLAIESAEALPDGFRIATRDGGWFESDADGWLRTDPPPERRLEARVQEEADEWWLVTRERAEDGWTMESDPRRSFDLPAPTEVSVAGSFAIATRLRGSPRRREARDRDYVLARSTAGWSPLEPLPGNVTSAIQSPDGAVLLLLDGGRVVRHLDGRYAAVPSHGHGFAELLHADTNAAYASAGSLGEERPVTGEHRTLLRLRGALADVLPAGPPTDDLTAAARRGLVSRGRFLVLDGDVARICEPPWRPAPASTDAVPTPPTAILPLELLADYEHCLARTRAGAESCSTTRWRGPRDNFRDYSPILLLGAPLIGWMLEVQTSHSRVGSFHELRLVDPENLHAFRLGRVPASRACNRETGEGGALAYADRNFGAFSANLLSARVLDDASEIELRLEEVLPGCGDCGCQCGTAHLFPIERPFRFPIPASVRRRSPR